MRTTQISSLFARVIICSGLVLSSGPLASAASAYNIKIDWDKVERVSQTSATLQVVVNPPLRRGTAIHDAVFNALRDLHCDYVRYVPWLPYPRLAVAELEPPSADGTSWDFSLIDPMTEDFVEATQGHSVILNFSTIPQWMFKTDKPVSYPADPDEVFWNYTQGTELRDPSMKELAGYYARLVSWYTRGGFVDELGKRHDSGHHFKIDTWEVWNEIDYEHSMTPQQYTARYDAVVEAIRKVAPEMKFVALALASPSKAPQFFEYFLDPRHHKPGIPLDMISYHFYASPGPDQSPEVQQFTFFEQADHFLDVVRFIESIRQRLSPHTRTTIDEIGSISADDGAQDQPGHVVQPVPNSYWNLSGAMYAYLFAELTQQGIEVVGESQLVGYPTQYPSVSMVDWNTGQPNARYWVLKLLHDNFGPGDKLVATANPTSFVYAQAFLTRDGRRKVLLINKRDRMAEFSLPGGAGAHEDYVDQTTAFHPPASAQLNGDVITLRGLAVAVVTLAK
jgi:hypothetical protein